MSQVELPPLPEPYYSADHDCGVEYPSWTADQVEGYGEACARAALEAAAQKFDALDPYQRDGLDGDFESGIETGIEQCVAIIRALSVGSGGSGS